MESIMRKSALIILMAAAAAAPVSAAAPQHKQGEAALQRLLEGRVAGKPETCLSLPGLGSSEVIDGTAIVYHRGSRLYVNRPKSGAKSLKSDYILVSRTSAGMLCNIDTIDLVDRYSRMQAGFVILGDFVPYDRPRGTN
jgi:hypothetical protein